MLLQDERPAALDGKHVPPAEQNYSAGEQTLLAVIHALELWRCHLDGVEFTVVTDHSPSHSLLPKHCCLHGSNFSSSALCLSWWPASNLHRNSHCNSHYNLQPQLYFCHLTADPLYLGNSAALTCSFMVPGMLPNASLVPSWDCVHGPDLLPKMLSLILCWLGRTAED